MKIQCPCGAKYSFDVTPENVATPVRFVCPSCGLDSSDSVNQLIHQQGASAVTAPASQPRVRLTGSDGSAKPAIPVAIPLPMESPPPEPVKVKLHRSVLTPPEPPAEPPPALPAPPVAESVASPSICLKHPTQLVSGSCLVCHKPICPKCMETFGYLCSAYCHRQAEKMRLQIPLYAGQQKAQVEKSRRTTRWILAGSGLAVVILLTVWGWYSFVGSMPRVVLTVKLPPGAEGVARLAAPDQAVVKIGNRLARYDVAKKKQVWSVALVDDAMVARAAEDQMSERRAAELQWRAARARLKAAGRRDEDGPGFSAHTEKSDAEELQDIAGNILDRLTREVRVHVAGQDIWAAFPTKLVRYEWATGRPAKEVSLPDKLRHFTATPNWLFALSQDDRGQQTITRVELPAGDARSEAMSLPSPPPPSKPVLPRRAIPARPKPVIDEDRPVESEADLFVDGSGTNLIGAGQNVIQLSVRLLEKKLVGYEAMKAAPEKSALENVTTGSSMEAANELLNEMHKDRTGGMRVEDESRYAVSLRRLMAQEVPEWSGEVVGPPQLHPLPTVDVLVAGKVVQVFDKSNRHLWQSTLNYPVAHGSLIEGGTWERDEGTELAPCIEHANTLYLFDQGILTAFELASGTARWRLPSVGITGVQFDERGMLYVTSTDARLDQIKYTEQIDVTRRTASVIFKVDPAHGKVLWRVKRQGQACWLSGKFFYAVESSHGDGDPLRVGLGIPAHMRLYRLDPENGRVIWEYYQKRAPLGVDFSGNTIQLLFENEMQVLRFLSL